MFTVKGQNDFLCQQNDAVLLRLGQILLTFFPHAEIFIFKSLKMAHKFIVKVAKADVTKICLFVAYVSTAQRVQNFFVPATFL